jgi:uncharacterized circularly permuted ATP-grasp superfamily protein
MFLDHYQPADTYDELVTHDRVPREAVRRIRALTTELDVDQLRERQRAAEANVDDAFLDPDAFNPESLLGCRGLMRAWRAGRVALVNAPGAGVADDKLVYSYVPDLIAYYLGEDPILQNVETFRLLDETQRRHVLENVKDFVIKPVNESGGYGVVVGRAASAAELEKCRAAIARDPRNFVAQPIVQLSTAPTLCDAGIEPRHLDLRPFVLSGEDQYVTRGGLTRVALRKGSLVVNSSQGGGSKDTWIRPAFFRRSRRSRARRAESKASSRPP